MPPIRNFRPLSGLLAMLVNVVIPRIMDIGPLFPSAFSLLTSPLRSLFPPACRAEASGEGWFISP